MQDDLFSLSSYHYELPQELIAQYPCTPRDSSRLMVIDRKSGNISETVFREIIDLFSPGDSLVFNDTKVIPSRLFGTRKGGGISEVFLTHQRQPLVWEVMAKPGKKLPVGSTVTIGEDLSCEIIEILPDGRRVVRFDARGSFEELLLKYGKLPLPSYIKREAEAEVDADRYQTVYAKQPGALAAPTAGLHFTDELMQEFSAKGIGRTTVTLHVGLGTFLPVKTEDIREHQMHSERMIIQPSAAKTLNSRFPNTKQICVGTTCVRTLESVATDAGLIVPGEFETSAFIYPGYRFKYVQHMLTNFHLPGSTLLMLVSAFAGRELIREAYTKAVKDRYRFFSYGDAMLIL